MQERDGKPNRSRGTTKREGESRTEGPWGGSSKLDHPVLLDLSNELLSLDLPRELAAVLDGVFDSLVVLRAESKGEAGVEE